jgi:hypothetical protein
VWPDEPPYPPDCEDRGWWSERFAAQIIFYDPADLAAVAQGAMEPWEPQPYAVMGIDEVLFNVRSEQQKEHVGAVAFDRERGLHWPMRIDRSCTCGRWESEACNKTTPFPVSGL